MGNHQIFTYFSNDPNTLSRRLTFERKAESSSTCPRPQGGYCNSGHPVHSIQIFNPSLEDEKVWDYLAVQQDTASITKNAVVS